MIFPFILLSIFDLLNHVQKLNLKIIILPFKENIFKTNKNQTSNVQRSTGIRRDILDLVVLDCGLENCLSKPTKWFYPLQIRLTQLTSLNICDTWYMIICEGNCCFDCENKRYTNLKTHTTQSMHKFWFASK